jgi:hypothetical protein
VQNKLAKDQKRSIQYKAVNYQFIRVANLAYTHGKMMQDQNARYQPPTPPPPPPPPEKPPPPLPPPSASYLRHSIVAKFCVELPVLLLPPAVGHLCHCAQCWLFFPELKIS